MIWLKMWRRSYWFQATALAVGVATSAVIAPLGSEAVFSVAALTAAALSAEAVTSGRLVA